MQAVDWKIWLERPETKLLLAYLARRRVATLQNFLAGSPVTTLEQGRAAALHELEQVFKKTPDEIRNIMENRTS